MGSPRFYKRRTLRFFRVGVLNAKTGPAAIKSNKNTMNWIVISSGILAFITAGVHIVAGGKEVARPLLAAPMDETVKLTMYACWHLVSVSLLLSSFALLVNGFGFLDSPPMVAFISALWLLYGIVFIVVNYCIASLPSLFRLPQWILLFPVGLLGLLGVILL